MVCIIGERTVDIVFLEAYNNILQRSSSRCDSKHENRACDCFIV